MMRATLLPTTDGRTRVRVEGRLTADTVPALRTACDGLAPDQLDLDLAALQFVDPAGVETLLELHASGTQLVAASGLVSRLLGIDDAPAATGDDGDLVRRLQAGDDAAYELFVRQHAGRMLATARRMVRSDDDAHDVVQEAFVSAFRSIGQFQGGARLSTWLHRIVVNAALMRLRAKRRRPEDSIEDLLPRFQEDGHFADPVSPWDTDTVALLERRESRDLVRRAIEQLPEDYRIVLVLRDIEDLDTDETAERLGITPNAAKIRLHRARMALRTLLQRELDGMPAAAATPRRSARRAG